MERPVQLTRRHAAARRRPTGFTLLEVLIVIGIIAVLVTIGVLGFRSMERASQRKRTLVTLATGEALLKGMNSVGSGQRVEGPADASPQPFYVTPDEPNTVLRAEAPGPIGTQHPDDRNKLILLSGSGLQTTPSVGPTKTCQRLMNILMSVPANKAAVTALTRDHLVESPDPAQPYSPPVLADGWGNPIILVPSGGLTKVTTEGGSNLTITSTGAVPTNNNPVPSNRPFWASAGPDGDFQKGDDNLYSFQR